MPSLPDVSEIGKWLVSVLENYFWPVLVFVAVVGWATFLLPDSLFVLLHIAALKSTYAETIGAATFLDTIALAVALVWYAAATQLKLRNNQAIVRQRNEGLHHLTPVEYSMLRNYIYRGTQTATFNQYDGEAAGLVYKGVLYKADSIPNRGGEQDYNIYPWAYEYLSQHRELFGEGTNANQQA